VPDPAEAPRKPKRRPPEEDPFAALGLRAGSFLIFPSVEVQGGYGDNLDLLPSHSRADAFGRTTGEVAVRSDWSRHGFEARLRGSLDADSKGEPIDGPTVNAEAKARLDLARATTLDLAGGYVQGRESRSSLTLPFGALDRPETRQSTLKATLTQAFNRLKIAVSGLFGRFESGDVDLANGTVLSGPDRAYDATEGRLRVGYEISPGLTPFADAYVNRRDYDVAVVGGVRRGSDGSGAEAGVRFDWHGLLTGEAAAGWQVQKSRDPFMPDLSGVTTRAALAWSPTPLTTIRLKAATGFDETPFASTALALTRSVGVELQHSLRADLALTANAGYAKEEYAGSAQEDRRTRAGVGLIFKATREVWLKANYAYEQLDSTFPAADYHANVVTLGVRIQR
jgi:hypothetical protein